MLILTRRAGEAIFIGDDIQILVTNVYRGDVELGIIAPPDKPIVRYERYTGRNKPPGSGKMKGPPRRPKLS